MRILHGLSTREFAGTERHVAELATFQSRTHDVTVLLERDTIDPRTGDDIAAHLGAHVTIRRAGRLGYAATLAALTRRAPYDVIHTHLGRASFRAGWLADRRAALVATLHNRYVSRAYARSDGLIAIAQWQMAELPPDIAARAAVIGNWTCPIAPDAMRRAAVRAEFGIADDIFLIGAAGRMVPEKCFSLLLDAFQAASLPNTRLILFGDGPEATALRAKAGQNVIFGGYRHNLKADMSALDAFALPSRREPFGLVLLEAMAANLPIRATASGGVLDILRDAPEAFLPPDDPEAWRIGLIALREQKKRVWDISAHQLADAAKRTEEFYAQIIARKQN